MKGDNMTYRHAIVCKPARSMVDGITTGMFSTETPVYEKYCCSMLPCFRTAGAGRGGAGVSL